MNIVDAVFQRCDRSAPALICGEEQISYGDLEQRVDDAAERLKNAGMPARRAGFVPRIGLACPNGVDHVVLALAILRSGGCMVPIASELAVRERVKLAEVVGLNAAIIADAMKWPDALDDLAGGAGERVSGLPVTIVKKMQGALPQSDGLTEKSFAGLNPALIRFSSGTTGSAKGIVLSHQTLLDRIETGNRRLQITARDRVVWILPMAHHFAVSIMLYLLKGAATIIVRSHFAEDILTAGIEHGGTVLYGAPFHHWMLSMEPSGRSWAALRLAVSTAAALPESTARQFDARYGVPLSQGLGIIEVGLPFLNRAASREKPLSIGCASEDVTFSLRDPRTLEPVLSGEPGELWVTAPGTLDAYLNPWKLRKDILVDGRWFRTGDLARVDSEGFLQICGRVKTVINVAGMKCFPEEVETVLVSHPQVRAALVSAKEHPQYGSVPVADIVVADGLVPSSEELTAFCRRELAAYKIPVEFRFVASLPQTASGKPRRVLN